MTTEEAVALAVYVVALLLLTLVFHRRYRCIRASLTTGFVSALLATSTHAALGPARFSPNEYIGGFIWFGVTPAIIGAFLSSMMGAAIQCKK
jgi:hypothetical protein